MKCPMKKEVVFKYTRIGKDDKLRIVGTEEVFSDCITIDCAWWGNVKDWQGCILMNLQRI